MPVDAVHQSQPGKIDIRQSTTTAVLVFLKAPMLYLVSLAWWMLAPSVVRVLLCCQGCNVAKIGINGDGEANVFGGYFFLFSMLITTLFDCSNR